MDCGPHFPTPEEDACVLMARREALRTFAREVAEAVQALHLPETYLEAERAARAVTVADRFMVRVREATLGGEDDMPPPSSTPKERDATSPAKAGEDEGLNDETNRLRLHLRAYADRVMEAATFIPKPDNFLEGERAGRYGLACERMLIQLYAPPKSKASISGFDDEAEDDDTPAPKRIFSPLNTGMHPDDGRSNWDDWQFKLEDKLNRLAEPRRQRAEETGFWPDGRPYVPDIVLEGPQRPNPDGSIVCTFESLRHKIALEKAAQDAANAAHGWSPPPDPADVPP